MPRTEDEHAIESDLARGRVRPWRRSPTLRPLRERLARVGLRWRLAAWVAVAVLLGTGVSFVVVYRGTGTQLRKQIDSELAGSVGALSRDLTRAHEATPNGTARVAARYVRDQSFAGRSAVVFVLVPGMRPRTNRPELFSQSPSGENGVAVQQSDSDEVSRRLVSAPDRYSTQSLPDIGALRLLKRSVRLSGDVRATIGVGEPLSVVDRAEGDVARAFVLAGILALAGAILASHLIGSRVSQPLRHMASIAMGVDAGDPHPRILDVDSQAREVRVLADSFNHMLERLTAAFAGQRAFVADASHELRTPLTVIRGQLEVLATESEPSTQDVRRVERHVRNEIVRMMRLVDDLLLLAKSEQTEFLRLEDIDLPRCVSELWDGVSLIADRQFELGTPPSGTLHADQDRLMQALRNLIDNAIAHTDPGRGLVRLAVAARPGGRVRFTVDDDGPGIEASQRERVFDRLHRIDAARDRASGGAGLGLAIVRAIAEAHGGTATVGESPEGGARLELELPGFSDAIR